MHTSTEQLANSSLLRKGVWIFIFFYPLVRTLVYYIHILPRRFTYRFCCVSVNYHFFSFSNGGHLFLCALLAAGLLADTYILSSFVFVILAPRDPPSKITRKMIKISFLLYK